MILSMFSPAPCIFLSILCAGLCVPGQSSCKSSYMIYTERRDGVSGSVYDMLHTDAKGYNYCKWTCMHRSIIYVCMCIYYMLPCIHARIQ